MLEKKQIIKNSEKFYESGFYAFLKYKRSKRFKPLSADEDFHFRKTNFPKLAATGIFFTFAAVYLEQI
jgi:hypothetical protein